MVFSSSTDRAPSRIPGQGPGGCETSTSTGSRDAQIGLGGDDGAFHCPSCRVTRTVKVPKRYDGRARGFAFVEFERPQDAASARRALGAAHLYGRHLVIDWAENEGEGIS